MDASKLEARTLEISRAFDAVAESALGLVTLRLRALQAIGERFLGAAVVALSLGVLGLILIGLEVRQILWVMFPEQAAGLTIGAGAVLIFLGYVLFAWMTRDRSKETSGDLPEVQPNPQLHAAGV